MGFNVLRVMGWDSFGLPAERRAERDGRAPARDHRRATSPRSRASSRSSACRTTGRASSRPAIPRYYKWTQWIFEVLFERGLAYHAEVAGQLLPGARHRPRQRGGQGRQVHRDRRPGREAADEAVDAAHHRSTPIGCVEDLDGLDWPAGTHKAQRDWIGKSIGANVVFEIVGRDDAITVFTTRPDTLFGGTYVVLAPEHPLVDTITTPEQRAAVAAYRDAGRQAQRARSHDRGGRRAEDRRARPARSRSTRSTAQQIPIWIADYVLASYGTGAVFACPAHDERDHAFAKTVRAADRRGREGRRRAARGRVHRRRPARQQRVPRRARHRRGQGPR